MGRRVRLGIIVYKEVDEDGSVWYVAEEPQSGARAQGESVEEAVRRVIEEIPKMLASWCESEVREAVDARLVEVDVEDSAGEELT